MTDAYHEALALAIEHTARPRVFQPRTGDELFALFTGSGESRRMAESRFAFDMYCGDQLRYLTRLPNESPLEFQRRPHKQFLNLTRVVIDVLSQLYRRPVTRHAGERIARVHAFNPVDRLMLGVDRLARLQGVCAVCVSYEDNEVRYWPWPAHRLIVLPDEMRPDQPRGVVAIAAGDGSLAHVWTPGHFSTVAGGRVVREHAHGYGRVPFAFVHDRLPVDGFWVEGRGRSLAWANNEFNAKLSELAHTVAMQGFGVMEIVNPDPAQDITVGPARAIRFTVNGNEPFGVNFKAPGAPIRELIDDLEFLLRTLLKTQRVPESLLSVQPLSNASGVSILAQQTPVLEDRIERQQVFRAFEHDLAQATRTVLAVHEGYQPEATLHVDYPEPELEQSVAERIAADEFKLRHGLVMPWELMQRDDPDRFESPEQARQQWMKNKSEPVA
ncbi:MAG: hypothetical protein KF696_08540 [Planctomycetes bacterium]|nr:hypothetical protein [Planctomycetota bacterium]MCW8135602.1 hypothetical protein [Planctomycetota bacterium]